jgi:hypothetical protein
LKLPLGERTYKVAKQVVQVQRQKKFIARFRDGKSSLPGPETEKVHCQIQRHMLHCQVQR